MASPQKGVDRQAAIDAAKKILTHQSDTLTYLLQRNAENPSVTRDNVTIIQLSTEDLTHISQLRTFHTQVLGIIEALGAGPTKLDNLNKAQLASLTQFTAKFKEILALVDEKLTSAAPPLPPLDADGSAQVPPLSSAETPVGGAAASAGTVTAIAAVPGATATVTVDGRPVTPPASEQGSDDVDAEEDHDEEVSGPGAASSSDDEGDANPADIATAAAATATAQREAAQGRGLLQAGLHDLTNAGNEDERRQAAERAALAARGASAAAAGDKAAHVDGARTAARDAAALQGAADALRDKQATESKAAAAADRERREEAERASKATRDAAVHAQAGATLATEGRVEVAQGLGLVQDAAAKKRFAAAKLADQSKQAATAADRLQQQVVAVAAQTGITPDAAPAALPPTASPAGSLGVNLVPPAELPTDKPGTPAAVVSDVKEAKSDACKPHPVKRTLDKKVVGTLIALGSVALTAGALLFAPQYVIYVGSVALVKLGIHATILAAKITGSLLITAATATLLTGIAAAVNAVMNYLHAGPKVKAVAKLNADGTATTETTDAAGHKAEATADAQPTTSTKGIVSSIYDLFSGSTTATATAAAPAPAGRVEATVDSDKAAGAAARI